MRARGDKGENTAEGKGSGGEEDGVGVEESDVEDKGSGMTGVTLGIGREGARGECGGDRDSGEGDKVVDTCSCSDCG